MSPAELTRLISMDAALASGGGLHIGKFAKQIKVCTKTVRRLLDVVAVECDTVLELDESDFTWRYANHGFQLFTPAVHRKFKTRTG